MKEMTRAEIKVLKQFWGYPSMKEKDGAILAKKIKGGCWGLLCSVQKAKETVNILSLTRIVKNYLKNAWQLE
jgi:hypothetical protein